MKIPIISKKMQVRCDKCHQWQDQIGHISLTTYDPSRTYASGRKVQHNAKMRLCSKHHQQMRTMLLALIAKF